MNVHQFHLISDALAERMEFICTVYAVYIIYIVYIYMLYILFICTLYSLCRFCCSAQFGRHSFSSHL